MLGKTLSRIGFWYGGWYLRMGCSAERDDQTSASVKEKAIATADEAIKVFEEVKSAFVLIF